MNTASDASGRPLAIVTATAATPDGPLHLGHLSGRAQFRDWVRPLLRAGGALPASLAAAERDRAARAQE
jgi:hypothetical protein